jgi:hypothetical protein
MARWKKGESGNPKGKDKGTLNHDKRRFKEFLEKLLEDNAPKMESWLNDIAKDDPMAAFSVIKDFAEFCHPKLARTETVHEYPDGHPLEKMEFAIVLPKKDE